MFDKKKIEGMSNLQVLLRKPCHMFLPNAFLSSVGGKGGSLSAITQRERERAREGEREREIRISRAYVESRSSWFGSRDFQTDVESRWKRQRLASEQGSEGNLGVK